MKSLLLCIVGVSLAACMVQTTPAPRSSRSDFDNRPPPRHNDDRPPPPPDQPPPPSDRPPPDHPHERPWDTRGWTLLGEKTVDGRVDSDQVDFSQKWGTVSKLMIQVLDSDLEMIELRIVYVSGNDFRPTGRHYFREGSRTRSIDLPGNEILRAVQFKYRNLPGGGRARVQVWKKD